VPALIAVLTDADGPAVQRALETARADPEGWIRMLGDRGLKKMLSQRER